MKLASVLVFGLLASCATTPRQVISTGDVQTVSVTLINNQRNVFILKAGNAMTGYRVELPGNAATATHASANFRNHAENREFIENASSVVNAALSAPSLARSDLVGDIWLVSVTSGTIAVDATVGPDPKYAPIRNPLENLTTQSKRLVERSLAVRRPIP